MTCGRCRDFASCPDHAAKRSTLPPLPVNAAREATRERPDRPTAAEMRAEIVALRARRSPEGLAALAALRWSAAGEWSARITPEQSKAVLDMLGEAV